MPSQRQIELLRAAIDFRIEIPSELSAFMASICHASRNVSSHEEGFRDAEGIDDIDAAMRAIKRGRQRRGRPSLLLKPSFIERRRIRRRIGRAVGQKRIWTGPPDEPSRVMSAQVLHMRPESFKHFEPGDRIEYSESTGTQSGRGSMGGVVNDEIFRTDMQTPA
jgi:hypothetical protein